LLKNSKVEKETMHSDLVRAIKCWDEGIFKEIKTINNLMILA
jgi:hypothetical protein